MRLTSFGVAVLDDDRLSRDIERAGTLADVGVLERVGGARRDFVRFQELFARRHH